MKAIIIIVAIETIKVVGTRSYFGQFSVMTA